jgi:hypothetical protein
MHSDDQREKTPATLPDQAIADLMGSMTGNESDEIKALSQVLVFHIPTTANAISLLCQLLVEMEISPSGISIDELNKINRQWSTTPDSIKRIRKSDQIGSRFPVLFGINKFYRRWKQSKSKDRKRAYIEACRLFISTSYIAHDEECKEDHYYRHTYKLRDVLLEACQELTPSSDESIDSYRQRTIQFLTNSSNESEDWGLALSLLDRNRAFGSYLRKIDKSEAPVVKELINSDDAPSSTPYSTTESSDPYDEGTHEATYQRTTGKNGSRITKKDDQRALFYRYQAIGARNNVATTDPHRLTLAGVARFLDHLYHHGNKFDVAYAFILATCGIPEKNLAEVLSTTEALKFEKRLIFYRRDLGTLFISLNNGKTSYPDFDGNHKEQFMEILLPNKINAIIQSSPDDEYPFRDVAINFDKQAHQFGVHNPGLSPTARRIKNTFNTVFVPGCFKGQFEASFLGGNLPYQHRAQAHYYRFDICELNQKYQAGVANFIDRIIKYGGTSPELKQFLTSCCKFNYEFLPQGHIGSQLYADRDEYLSFMKNIRTLLKTENQSVHCLEGQAQIECMLSLLQLQHLYLYLLIQILIALRPPGKQTAFVASEQLDVAYSKTKASADFIELNLAPVHRILKEQIQQVEMDLEQFKKWAAFRGIPFILYDQGFHDLPLTFNQRNKSNVIVSQRFTGAKARALITRIAEESNLPLQLPFRANNIFRHINATQLYQDVPEIVLDEYMGHGREGLDMFNEWSTTSFTCYPLLEDAVEKLAQGITKSPLRINFHV